MTIEIIHPESQETWLALRVKDITSTEAPALFGLSPYMTSFELWHRKKDAAVVDFIDNERVRWGSRLQDAIAAGIAKDNGWTVRRMDEYVRDAELRLGASFDFRVLKGDTIPEGMARVHQQVEDTASDELLEIKNVDALQFRDKWLVEDDGTCEAPPHIECQVQHQLLVSGLKKATIGALIGGNKVVLIKRDRDEKIIAAIKTRAAQFWKSIADNVEPKPDFMRDAEFISTLYGFADPGKVMTNPDVGIGLLVASYQEYQKAEKLAQEGKEAAKAELLTRIGDCEKVVSDEWSISAGMVGPAHIEYDRKPYRGFRVNAKKTKGAKA